MNGSRSGAKLWSGRFSGKTDVVVERYTNSVREDRHIALFDVLGSIAHARMLGRQRIIAKKDADEIERGLRKLLASDFQLRPELEDVHTNIEVQLGELIGDAAGRLHTARSRNDQVATAFRMYAREAAEETTGALLGVMGALVGLAEAQKTVVMPGYTHLQRAQPILMAHHLLAYFEMLRRDLVRFELARTMADACPLGAGALAGVPYPIDRDYVASELGFGAIKSNSIDAVADRDFAVDYVYAASLAMVHVSRLAEDLILWSSAEFGFITLPDAFATGSSIMPQKKNPDVAELARGRTGRVVGSLVSLLMMLKGLPLAYNRDLQEDKPAFFEAEDTLLSTLDVLARMLPKIEVNVARAREAAVANYSLATDLADFLVRKGLPFRQAHEAVGGLVRRAESQGVELQELSLREWRTFSPLFDAGARKIDVMASLRSRNVPGGTAPRRVHAELRKARRFIERARADRAEDAR